MATDPYWKILCKNQPHIERVYDMWAKKRPIILYDVQQRLIYAYHYESFLNGLSERSQVSLKEQYERANANGMFVVFVRDNKKKKLRSYSVPVA